MSALSQEEMWSGTQNSQALEFVYCILNIDYGALVIRHVQCVLAKNLFSDEIWHICFAVEILSAL